ncbi:MAG: DNA gyrase inhibitor YacG [Rhodospirillales bacterium]
MSENPRSTVRPTAEVIPLKSADGGCPICRRPTVQAYRPFCSKRCADRDLGHWLNETYRVETDEGPVLDETPEDER